MTDVTKITDALATATGGRVDRTRIEAYAATLDTTRLLDDNGDVDHDAVQLAAGGLPSASEHGRDQRGTGDRKASLATGRDLYRQRHGGSA